MTAIELFVLGTPRIERNHASVHLDTRKAIAMLAYLAVNEGYQSRDTLAALLWAESDHAGARGALRRTISTLNTALGGAGLLIEREAIALDPKVIWCDLSHFQSLLRGCDLHGHTAQEVCPRCCAPLQESINLYRGDFLQGFSLKDSAEFDLWQFQHAEYTQRFFSAALEKLVHLCCEDGTFEVAAHLAQRWLSLDPLHESAHRHLMEIYAWSGQRSTALKQYQDCVRILDQELGVPPLAETTRLYQLIMENSIHARTTKHDFREIAPAPSSRATQTSSTMLPLVGRDDEVRQMDSIYKRLAATVSSQQIVVIEGEAGIGKSRLTGDFLERAGVIGSRSFVVCSYDNESQAPYAALTRSLQGALRSTLTAGLLSERQLSELARLLPDVLSMRPDLPAPLMLEGVAAQNRLFEAVCQALRVLVHGDQPGILVFEDMQWLDSATLDLLTYLIRRVSDARLLYVFTWRSEEVARTHRLRSLLTDYRRNGGITDSIILGRLDQQAVIALVHSLGASLSPVLVERLYQESEGLPLFLNEYLVLLRTQPDERHHAQGGTAPVQRS